MAAGRMGFFFHARALKCVWIVVHLVAATGKITVNLYFYYLYIKADTNLGTLSWRNEVF